MDKSIGILVISDMHITDKLYGRRAGESMFMKDKSFETNFRRSLEKEIEAYGINLKYILVLGDSSDFSLSSEFEKAKGILHRLCDWKSIDKRNVLIIPGNHDMSREKFRYYCYEKKIKREDFVKNQALKFEDFTNFYDSFYEMSDIKFDPNKAITRVLYVEELNIVFIGINSIYQDSYIEEDHCGYINYSSLESELENVYQAYPNAKIIALMHHTPQAIGDGRNTIKNWGEVSALFGDKVLTFIAGHAHTIDGLTAITKERRNYLTSGSLSTTEKDVRNSYMLLKYEVYDGKEALKVLPYNYEGDYNPASKYWQLQSAKENIMSRIFI